ncbi:energy transducer TonB [Flavobacterium sp. DGU11]|uniref:Energy transducer TonB n=1 Tax=Flavobacterium arundinis TaxID=3139143 RepID=A0ABU9HV89_9FLAO
MKKLYLAFGILSLLISVNSYGQVKPVEKNREVDEEKLIRLDDDYPDVVPPQPGELQNEDTIYELSGVEVLPEFPGGIKSCMAFFDKNIRKDDFVDAPDGTYKVHVTFIVEKDGSMTNATLLRDPGYGIGKEVLRVLKSMKYKWRPGILNGKMVRVRYLLQIPVTLGTPKATGKDAITEDETIYSYGVDKQPEFAPEKDAFTKYLISKLKTGTPTDEPFKAMLHISFIVEKDGTVSSPEVRDNSHRLEKTLINALLKSPKWKPAEKDGKKVRYKVSLPIVYQNGKN